jgi:hypothetical protein
MDSYPVGTVLVNQLMTAIMAEVKEHEVKHPETAQRSHSYPSW